VTPTPPVTASSPFARAPAAVGPSSSEPPSGEPPIERLLRSQAASLEPPRRLQPPPPPPPSPPPSPPPPAPAPPAPLVPSLPPSAPVPRAASEPVASGLDAAAGEAGSVEIFEPPSGAALEEAVMSAPVEDRAAWQRHMAQLALHAGQALLARVQAGAGDAGERIDTLRAAIAWFESGLTVAADDETLHDAVRTARASLWPTYEEAVTALLQRQEFHVARRLLREAQADEDCPPPVQASFREMLAATFGGEVGQ